MKKDLNDNERSTAIASIIHNLECVEEAQSMANIEDKKLYSPEKARLTKLLNDYSRKE